jgi:general stress protein YciG
MSKDTQSASQSSRDEQGRFTGGEAAQQAGQKGGKASSGSFEKGSERAREAGRKGGKASGGSNS